MAALRGSAPSLAPSVSAVLLVLTPCQALRWYVKTETFVKGKPFPQIRPHLEAHKRWVADLRAEGTVQITSGYRVDSEDRPGGGGLMLFAARDYEEAEALVLQDPLIANGCVDWRLHRWIAEVGDIKLVEGGTWYDKRDDVGPRGGTG